MEDEEDYMSEEFLKKWLWYEGKYCTVPNLTLPNVQPFFEFFSAPDDVRPGLLFSQKNRREHLMHKKKEDTKILPFKVVSENRLETGLNTALPESNKGFAMLKKMGYNPNKGIGKSQAGPSEPIKIELKKDSFGLGLRKEIKTRKEDRVSMSTDQYRKSLKEKQEFNDTKYDYMKIRRMCHTLDEKAGIKVPFEKWYWPDEAIPVSSNESSDSESEKEEEILSLSDITWRLQTLVKYVRSKYHYCIWCAISFEDEKDMADTCPGRTRELHFNDGNGEEANLESD